MTDTVPSGARPAQSPHDEAPYPGPRPFGLDDRHVFFGREAETLELVSLVMANALVVLYAASGAGKSSLIRAGLIPELRKRSVTVLAPLRLRSRDGQSESAARVANHYVRSLAVDWATAEEMEAPGVSERRAARLSEVTDLPGLVAAMVEETDGDPDDPCVLVVDQFEEMFYDPVHWPERDGMFVQFESALAADPQLRVLLAMREDYLPQTHPYEALVSSRLQQRMRIDALTPRQAREAITRPAQDAGRPFDEAAADHLMAQLLQLSVERAGQATSITGRTVEPVQLQVVCQSLWEELPSSATTITYEYVRRFANVDEVLGRFYDRVVRHAAATQRLIKPRRIRTWIERDLITGAGTRGMSAHSEATAAGVPEAALRVLVEENLLRREYRNGSQWYELTHDRLIGPIREVNRGYVERRGRRLSRAGGVVSTIAAALAIAVALLLGNRQTPRVRTNTVTRTTTRVVASTSPTPPTIRVPVNGAVYRLHQVVGASYTCPPTVTWRRPRCHAPAAVGAPIDTSAAGRHVFLVSARYGRSDIITARRVIYTVVAFSSRSFSGSAFSVSYPTSWRVTAAEIPRGGYTDTRIAAPRGGGVLQIDVTPRVVSDLRAKVLTEVNALAHEPRYRQLSLTPVQLSELRGGGALSGASHLRQLRLATVGVAGLPGIDWQFVVLQRGVLLRKEDVFFDDVAGHDSFAVLTEAPVRSWSGLAPMFAQARATLLLH